MPSANSMRGRTQAAIVGLAFAIVAVRAFPGCGGSDHGPSVAFSGNVSSVSAQAKLESSPRRWLSRLDGLWPASAIAQSTSVVNHVLVCASNGRDPSVCNQVNSDGDFFLALDATDSDF